MSAAAYVTVEQIQAGSGLSREAIRKKAHDHKWRKLGSRPQKYRLEDVQRTMQQDKRHAVRERAVRKLLDIV